MLLETRRGVVGNVGAIVGAGKPLRGPWHWNDGGRLALRLHLAAQLAHFRAQLLREEQKKERIPERHQLK